MDNLNYNGQIDFKPKPKIENEALRLLHHYKPEFLKDLSSNIDTHDFIFEFIPKHIQKTQNRKVIINFNDNLPDTLAGQTTYYEIDLNSRKYDSQDVRDQRMMNFTIAHEGYHSLFHSGYLMPMDENLQMQLFKTVNKVSEFTVIKTLNRDLEQLQEKINPFCYQANIFAACFLIPRERMKKAICEIYKKPCIEIDNLENEEIKGIAKKMQEFFDLNIQPLTIALKEYELVKQKDVKHLCFDFCR
jgi:Zn-dependent peptidase ImmA (M78 family)